MALQQKCVTLTVIKITALFNNCHLYVYYVYVDLT
jgi:hypothetical protein